MRHDFLGIGTLSADSDSSHGQPLRLKENHLPRSYTHSKTQRNIFTLGEINAKVLQEETLQQTILEL